MRRAAVRARNRDRSLTAPAAQAAKFGIADVLALCHRRQEDVLNQIVYLVLDAGMPGRYGTQAAKGRDG